MTLQSSNADSPPSDELLTVSQLAGLLQMSRRTIYNRNRAGLLPKPIRMISGKHFLWKRSEVMAWLNRQADAETLLGVIKTDQGWCAIVRSSGREKRGPAQRDAGSALKYLTKMPEASEARA